MNGTPSCRIFLLRHGETLNAGKICFNGHYDVEVSTRGKEQFRGISDALREFPLEAVYCSDLRRTRDCAEIICQPHPLKPIACPEIRELSFGIWEGLSVEEVNRKYPGQLEKRLQNIATFCVEGGETFAGLQERVLPKFTEIVEGHAGGNIVIVSHGGVNRVIIGHILGIPIENIFRIRQEYAAVNIIQFYNGGNAVVELTGGSHREIIWNPPSEKTLKIQ